ncbi:hypothetical protein ABID29_000802 [Streptococcus rupicaprae]|uniref:Uncharacterized protein n=1 Tax=Streptococcus rupicaprae TaxID=759619 RepID=A0ABV2FGJ7_9STRE
MANVGAFSIIAMIISVLSTALTVFIAAHIVRYVFKDVIDKYLNK